MDEGLTQRFFPILLALVLVVLWMAYWLWTVDWRKVWPVLAEGAWAPVVLLSLLSAQAWSRIAPGPYNLLGVVTIPTFWWHLGAVAGLVSLALFSGWLQGQMNYAPPEIEIEPAGDDHGHDHGHAHHEGHAPAHDHGHGHH
jgi:hypothetical protein